MADPGVVDIQMPQMGESVTEGTVLEWHVAEGEFVSEGETVVEVSTDKVDAEVPAPASGVLVKILATEDETIEVGAALGQLDPEAQPSGNGTSAEGGEATDGGSVAGLEEQDGLVEGTGEGDADLGSEEVSAESAEPGQVETVRAEGETVQIAMPEMGESVTEGTVLEWHVSEGQAVAEGDTVVEVSTDKVDAEVPAPASGTITKHLADPDDVVEIGQPLAEMVTGAVPAGSSTPKRGPSQAPAARMASGIEGDGASASPVARRVAAAKGIDLRAIEGTGLGGKIIKADVIAATADGGGAARAPALEEGESRPLRGPARMLAEAMNQSREVPTATSFRTLPVDTLDAKRRAINGALSERGMKVSFTHLIAWAIVQSAAEWPAMARTYSEADGQPQMNESERVNLGIAVDVERRGERSLMVPCIRGAEALDFAGFHSSYEDLIRKTRENALSADDFQGTNITLTNPGGLGTVASVPRLMSGQGTIVATGSIAHPPEWAHTPPDKLRALGVSKVMTMTSTYDHRVIQGAESGSFLRRIDQFLQGEDGFYESVAEALGIDVATVTNATPAAASAPPLPVAAPAPAAPAAPAIGAEPDTDLLQAVQAATSLLKAYRTHGHLAARVNPLAGEPKGDPALEPENLNLTPELMKRIPASILRIGVEGETLLDALPRLRDAYCGTIAYQIEHLSSHQQRMWLRDVIETGRHREPLESSERRALLARLIEVFQFERFLQKAYLGQKMFSIEGLDVIVPMLDEIAAIAHRNGTEELAIGMAHRGRLSVLAHTVGRPDEAILAEFESAKALERVKAMTAIPEAGTGDVKYHHGDEGTISISGGGEIRARLYPNPSHLEHVNPVVTGGARAAQSERDGARLEHRPNVALPVLLHGDAAFPAQGVVAETLNLQSLDGYSTGGTIHIITDNQVGFTTAPREGRSTPYASDLAKGFNCPIIHVNADDVEACVAASRLAMGYRERWGRDVVIDVIGYRRYGHNETDEPAYTQPRMAKTIKEHPPVSELYARTLVAEGVVDAEEVERLGRERHSQLQATLKDLRQKMEAGEYEDPSSTAMATGELDRTKSPDIDTSVDEASLRSLNEELLRVPDSFTIHRKLRKPLQRRVAALEEAEIDFGHAEALAFASLLTEGKHIRLTGQDTERGTFSHRHLVLHDERTGLPYAPIQHLAEAKAPLEVHNSPLSEVGCVGFEYGYSAAAPDSLIIWEAQFGDFANAAQVVIDSFIVSGESKWGQTTRLTLLLPHGYEGGGPEHSSARIERFIQLASEGNIRLANPTTAAQYFHLLRRQAHVPKPRPLVCFTPKGLLRMKAAASSLDELTSGSFQYVLDDPAAAERREEIERLVLCSGKIYYDIEGDERRAGARSAAVARVELLYPFAHEQIAALIRSYPNLKRVVWTQEEPRNMGAWSVMFRRLPELLGEGIELGYAGRPPRASPSEGYPAAHRLEQERIVLTALEG